VLDLHVAAAYSAAMRVGRFLRRSLGCLLILCGLLCAFGWFYWLVPIRHTCDPRWCETHSQSEYWQEAQTAIRRGMWGHDDGIAVGLFGDKSWAGWIITHSRPGDDMKGCLGARLSHAGDALQYITNQDAGDKADDWLAWWQKNRLKSQLEWIQDGFRQHGISVSTPPTADQTGQLLSLLGNTQTNRAERVPRYLT